VQRRILVTQVASESILKILNALWFEAGEATVEHQLGQSHEFFWMLSDCEEALHQLVLK
jgi:hypothetical protein